MNKIISVLRIKRAIRNLLGTIRVRWRVRCAGNSLRIIVGSDNTRQQGWISTDYPILDLTDASSFSSLLKLSSVDNFLAEHVWEHLDFSDAEKAILNCYKYLKNGGRIRIAVPDGFHPDSDYINQVKPGGYGYGADDHKVLYDFRSLSALMTAAGFQVRLLEWFDEQGQFHFESWSADDGMVKRSTRFDPRNSANPITYTSLIIDGIKP